MNTTDTQQAGHVNPEKRSVVSRFLRGVLLGAVLYLMIQAFVGWP